MRNGWQITAIFNFEDLTESEWREIRAIGRDLYCDKVHKCDQFKIAVEAYHLFLTQCDDPDLIESQENPAEIVIH